MVVLEAERVGSGASGRNGGFCAASLTHGLGNGLLHFPDEIDVLEAEGKRNLAELVTFVRDERIDCDLEPTGVLDVATEPWQVEDLQAWVELAARHGTELEYLDRDAVQAEVHSPRWLAGVRAGADHTVMLDPAKLAFGLAAAAERRGATIHEASPVTAVRRRAAGVRVTTAAGATIDAAHVLVATSAYSGWLRRLTPLFVPVYDYVLVTEPLTPAQRVAIGWAGREGMSDAGNQFHYFRQTADGRILWGGYDAIYHPGNRVQPAYDTRPATFEKLARQFVETFPQLDGIRFTHAWGGAIDTTTRFTVTFGEALGGRVHYALGYTGLGVGSSRWAAGILRDRLLRPDSPLLRARARAVAPVPHPARADPDPGGRADAPGRDRRGRPRGSAIVVPARDGHARDRVRLIGHHRRRPLTHLPLMTRVVLRYRHRWGAPDDRRCEETTEAGVAVRPACLGQDDARPRDCRRVRGGPAQPR